MNPLIGHVLKGRYRVEAALGRGGMAEVYKVWDDERSTYLALKLLRQDLAQDQIFLRRFKREAQTLAKLQHPQIVRFYGLEQDGRQAFMLMDYIEGGSLQGEIFDLQGESMSPDRILEIMRPICGALHYAHRKGFVHCDLKPGNVLINKSGTVLLTDFGIARLTDTATMTMVGMGTPAYMAPELVKGQQPVPQTDIYSLGVILYEMVTGGERPFTGERATITGNTSEKVRWEQMQLEPPSPKRWNPEITPELDMLVLRCLAKEPGERYESTLDVLNGLESVLSEEKDIPRTPRVDIGEPARLEADAASIREPAPSAAEVEPEPAPLEALGGVPYPEKGRRTREPKRSWMWALMVIIVLIVMGKISMDVQQQKADQVTATARAQERATSTAKAQATSTEKAKIYARATETAIARVTATRVTVKASYIANLRGHTSGVPSVAFSPDGDTLASGSKDKTVILWDVGTGERIAILEGHKTSVYSVAFSPDGDTLASGSEDKTVILWDAGTGERIAILEGHTSGVLSVAFSPDGDTLASGSKDKTVILWDAGTGERIAILEGHTKGVPSVAFSLDGEIIASGSMDGVVILWDVETGERLAKLEEHTDTDDVEIVAFWPDGSTLTSVSDGGTVILWDAQTGNPIDTLEWYSGWVFSVAFSPDGETIAAGDWGTVILWEAGTGRRIDTRGGHNDIVSSVAFSPDGGTLASGARDGTIVLWEVE